MSNDAPTVTDYADIADADIDEELSEEEKAAINEELETLFSG